MSTTNHYLRLGACLIVIFATSCAPAINPTTNGLIQTTQINGIVHAMGTTTLTASCPAGQQMVGGGYAMTSYTPPLQSMYVIGNYPSSLDTWEIDVLNVYKDSAILVAYVYCYSGKADLGMQIEKMDNPIPTPSYNYQNMQFAYSYSSTVQKPKPGNVVTAGGYKLYTNNLDIRVSGSYPQITSSGSGNATIGWTTTTVIPINGPEPTHTVSTYVLSSAGSIKVVGNKQITVTPVFDQGNTILQTITAQGASQSWISKDLSTSPTYFTTGGGYNSRGGIGFGTQPIMTMDDNALTHAGSFYAWYFAGYDLITSAKGCVPWDIYTLQLKFH
jgi:hypothetical protein